MKEKNKSPDQLDRASMMVTVPCYFFVVVGVFADEVGTRFQISGLVFVIGKSQQQGLAATVRRCANAAVSSVTLCLVLKVLR